MEKHQHSSPEARSIQRESKIWGAAAQRVKNIGVKTRVRSKPSMSANDLPDPEEYPTYWQAHSVPENQELYSACGEDGEEIPLTIRRDVPLLLRKLRILLWQIRMNFRRVSDPRAGLRDGRAACDDARR